MPGTPSENLEFPCTDAAAIRAALARAEACQALREEDALKRLLHFAVEETLAGRRCKVKPAPAAKLRQHLKAYYRGEGQDDPVRIRLSESGAPPTFSMLPPVDPVPHPEVGLESPHAVRKLWLWLAILVTLSSIGGALWGISKLRAKSASATIRTVAVLPLADVDKQKEGDWLRFALTGELVDQLGRFPGLKTIAMSSSVAATGDPAQIGRQLGVAAVIQGNIRESGNHIKLEVTMTRAADGYQLWKDTYERDAPAIAERIAAAIASRIQLKVPPSPSAVHPVPARAFDAYLQGRYAMQQHDLERANQWFEQATRTHPAFAQAWAWLSMVLEQRVAAGKSRPNQTMPDAREAAERAVALNDRSPDAHLALGIVKLQYDWDWATAKAEFDRVLQLAPNSATALQWRARWYQSQGQFSAAEADLKLALALDPLSQAIRYDQAQQALAQNQLDRALELTQQALAANPGDSDAKALLADILFTAGKKEEAARAVAGMIAPAFRVAPLKAALGDPAAARETLDAAEDLPNEELMPMIVYARIAGTLGDWNRFFGWLEEARGERDMELPYLRLLPRLPRSDPRLNEFLASMNLPPLQ